MLPVSSNNYTEDTHMHRHACRDAKAPRGTPNPRMRTVDFEPGPRACIGHTPMIYAHNCLHDGQTHSYAQYPTCASREVHVDKCIHKDDVNAL